MRRFIAVLVFTLAIVAFPGPVMAGFDFFNHPFYEPFATVISPTADQVIRTWRADGLHEDEWNLGFGADLSTLRADSDNIDVIYSLTGAVGLTDRITLGVTIPYIARDDQFNFSELLDVKTFLRYRLAGERARGFRLSSEVWISYPTAGDPDIVTSGPVTQIKNYSLDTTVVRLGLGGSDDSGSWQYGFNLGYQQYLDSDSGDDADLLYGAYLEKQLSGGLSGLLEYAGLTHFHDDVVDQTIHGGLVSAGLQYRAGNGVQLGTSAGKGLSDSFAEWEWTGYIVVPMGKGSGPRVSSARRASGKRALQKAPEPPSPPSGVSFADDDRRRDGVLIEVANRSGVAGLGEELADFLKGEGYAVVLVDESGDRLWDRSYVYYRSRFAEQADGIRAVIPNGLAFVPYPYGLDIVDLVIVLGGDQAR